MTRWQPWEASMRASLNQDPSSTFRLMSFYVYINMILDAIALSLRSPLSSITPHMTQLFNRKVPYTCYHPMIPILTITYSTAVIHPSKMAFFIRNDESIFGYPCPPNLIHLLCPLAGHCFQQRMAAL